MSRFFSEKFARLTPYVPGEQPKQRKYIKLNTNESPFAPPASVVAAMENAAKSAQLYSDPTCDLLVKKAAETLGVKDTQVLPTNGSDEILNFAFMAFCDENTPAVFPDITYGFYEVFAALHGVECKKIPLGEDFSVKISDYFHAGGTVFLANPNAPTGLCLSLASVEEIVKNNPENVVVIDEAYVDFGGESAVGLVDKYENLLVTQTFSKSRSLAGARLGLGIGSESLIADLNTLKYSTNPYNVNSMTLAAGVAALEEQTLFQQRCQAIIENRAYTAGALKALGFEVLDSKTNFLFVKSPEIGGEELYLKLKQRGILVRHFSGARIAQFNRVSVGTKEEMDAFLDAVREILKEKRE